MNENKYQAGLIKRLEDRFDGCIVVKNDAKYKQGFPDLTVLWRDRWAALECKKATSSSHRPNQDYYISRLGDMSFARFICPENEEEVLDEMEQTFKSRRTTRISRSKQI